MAKCMSLKDLANTATCGTYIIVLDLKTMSTDKIPPKIDTVVILGCFLMAVLDFQPPFRPAHFYSKTYVIDHISLLTSSAERPEVISVNSHIA